MRNLILGIVGLMVIATALPTQAGHTTFSAAAVVLAPNPGAPDSSVTVQTFLTGCVPNASTQDVDAHVYNIAGFDQHRLKTNAQDGNPPAQLPDFDVYYYDAACVNIGACAAFGNENCLVGVGAVWAAVVYFAGIPNQSVPVTITCNALGGPPGC